MDVYVAPSYRRDYAALTAALRTHGQWINDYGAENATSSILGPAATELLALAAWANECRGNSLPDEMVCELKLLRAIFARVSPNELAEPAANRRYQEQVRQLGAAIDDLPDSFLITEDQEAVMNVRSGLRACASSRESIRRIVLRERFVGCRLYGPAFSPASNWLFDYQTLQMIERERGYPAWLLHLAYQGNPATLAAGISIDSGTTVYRAPLPGGPPGAQQVFVEPDRLHGFELIAF